MTQLKAPVARTDDTRSSIKKPKNKKKKPKAKEKQTNKHLLPPKETTHSPKKNKNKTKKATLPVQQISCENLTWQQKFTVSQHFTLCGCSNFDTGALMLDLLHCQIMGTGRGMQMTKRGTSRTVADRTKCAEKYKFC